MKASENTLAAFNQALENGADAFECDVVLTRDGEPVVIHLPFYSGIAKLWSKHAILSEMKWTDLKEMRTNKKPIPHLYEVLDFVSTRSIECFIEPKMSSNDLVENIVKSIQQYQVVNKTQLLTFYSRKSILTHSKKLNPNLRTSVILITPFGDWQSRARSASADTIAFGWKGFNYISLLDTYFDKLTGNIKEAQQQGIEVYSGIADDEKNIAWLCKLGVNGIFTNNVLLAKKVIDSYQG